MTAPIDVLAVLQRHAALADQVACQEQRAEAHAVFDAVAELVAAVADGHEVQTRHGYLFVFNEAQSLRLGRALLGVGGAE
jgi:hypothetical protein